MKNAIKRVNKLIERSVSKTSEDRSASHRRLTVATPAPPRPVRPVMAGDLSLAPLRSFDDFLLSFDRFRLPRLQDVDKWNRRVLSNLHYYQTNYLVVAVIVFTLVG